MQKPSVSKLLGMILAVLLIGISAAAMAQAPQAGPGGGRGGRGMFGNPQAFFQQLDANHDGNVTEQEFTDGMQNMMQNRGNRGNRGAGPGGGQGTFQERMMNNIKDRLGATDEEWTVLQARIQKVMDAQQQVRPFEGRGGFGRGRGGRGFGGNNNEPAEVQALNDTIDNSSSTEAQIATALKNYRAARDKAQTALKSAQDDLKKVVTPKQEAVLVTMGMIE